MPTAPDLKPLHLHALRDRLQDTCADPTNLIEARKSVIRFKFMEAAETVNFCREAWDHEPGRTLYARDYANAVMRQYTAMRASFGVANEGYEEDEDDALNNSHPGAPASIEALVRRSLRTDAENGPGEHHANALMLRERERLQQARDYFAVFWNSWQRTRTPDCVARSWPQLEGVKHPLDRQVIEMEMLYRTADALLAQGHTEHHGIGEVNAMFRERREAGEAAVEARAQATLARLRSKKTTEPANA